MRTNKTLKQKLEQIWNDYFSDVPRNNYIQISFGKKARKRLGSIRQRYVGENCSVEGDTCILINGHFKDHYIPDYILDATIAHELCHYVHGFGSPLPQLSRFPHRGGKVDQEMEKRGLNSLVLQEQEWLNENWLDYLAAQ